MQTDGALTGAYAPRRIRRAFESLSFATSHFGLRTRFVYARTMSHYPPYSTSGTTYPYAGYHPQTAGTYAHPQSSGAYPTAQYQPYAPPTAVTSYGTWPYHGYSYYPQQQQQQAHTPVTTAPRPATTSATTSQTTTTAAPITATPAIASSLATRPAVPSTYTFTSYNRDPNLYGRSGRKGSSYRGLFTKERECCLLPCLIVV